MCGFIRVIAAVSALGFFSMSAWCSRMDGGKSGYGASEDMTCPSGAGIPAPGSLPGGLTVTCGTDTSSITPTPTIFDFKYTGVIPRLSLFVTFPAPLLPASNTGGTFGLIIEDSFSSTVPFTQVTAANSGSLITSSNNLSSTPGLPTLTLNNVGDVPGDIVVYFSGAADLTAVSIASATPVPEPRYLGLLGFGLLAVGLWAVRRRAQVSSATP